MVNKGYQGYFPLHAAVLGGNVSVVTELLNARAMVDVKLNMPLKEDTKDLEEREAFRKRLRDLHGFSAIEIASHEGGAALGCLPLLIAAGAAREDFQKTVRMPSIEKAIREDFMKNGEEWSISDTSEVIAQMSLMSDDQWRSLQDRAAAKMAELGQELLFDPALQQSHLAVTDPSEELATNISHRCANCDTVSKRLQTCNGCGWVSYCNAACQKAHWKRGHKHFCKQLASCRGHNNWREKNEAEKEAKRIEREARREARLKALDEEVD